MKKFKLIFSMAAIVAAVSVSGEEHADKSLVLPASVNARSLSVKTSADSLKLSGMKKKYVLLQFWSSNTESSLKNCIALNNVISKTKDSKIELIPVSFEPLKMAYDDMLKSFDLKSSSPIMTKDGLYYDVYAKYRLSKSLGNYLIDENGVVVAKDLTPEDLSMYTK